MHSVAAKSLIAVCAGIALSSSAQAVIVAGNNGLGNTTAPTGMTNQFGAVATIGTLGGGSGSGVYIGNGWMLTANHVTTLSPFTFTDAPGSPSYTVLGTQQLHTPTNSSDFVDLKMVHLSGSPSLPTMSIGLTAPTTANTLTMIGAGRNRVDIPSDASDLFFWNSSTNPWTETTSSGSWDKLGYKWNMTSSSDPSVIAATRDLRWGVNTAIDQGAGVTTVSEGNMTFFKSQFGTFNGSSYSALVNEGQAAEFDSGGGVFTDDGQLRGIMLYVANFTTQPANTSVFLDQTYMADLSVYRDQIYAIAGVPEPTMIAGLALVGMGLLRRTRRCN
jgi:hypothetical protein